MTEVKCIIFDCDGVLIDSELISARLIIEELAREDVVIDLPYVLSNFTGRSFTKVAGHVFDHFGVAVTDDFEARYRSSLLSAFVNELRPMAGIVEVLESLDVPCCVATSSSPARVRSSLKLTGLEKFFGDRVFTASQVRNGKPAPDLFLFAADNMRTLFSNCLVVEDSAMGIEAARRAHMPVCRFTGGSHFGVPGMPPFDTAGVKNFDSWAVFPDMLAAMHRGRHHAEQI